MEIDFSSVQSFGRIGVLMGGPSSEREISLKSGGAVLDALLRADVEAVGIDILTDSIEENKALVRAQRLDCAFIALHGRFGEDGAIQKILEEIDIVYTGSNVLASRLAMDKSASRNIFIRAGLSVPDSMVTTSADSLDIRKFVQRVGYPVVVKPATHGSSIGLTIVDTDECLRRGLREAFRFDSRVVLEGYIEGREVTVGILGGQALPVIEVVPKNKVFDYKAKYEKGMTEYIVPAHLEPAVACDVQDAALTAHNALGCFGCSRVDIMLRDATPYVLEVNTIPGMTSTSLLPKAAKAKGIEFTDLCLTLIALAYEKAKNTVSC